MPLPKVCARELSGSDSYTSWDTTRNRFVLNNIVGCKNRPCVFNNIVGYTFIFVFFFLGMKGGRTGCAIAVSWADTNIEQAKQ